MKIYARGLFKNPCSRIFSNDFALICLHQLGLVLLVIWLAHPHLPIPLENLWDSSLHKKYLKKNPNMSTNGRPRVFLPIMCLMIRTETDGGERACSQELELP
jgi:hypothetical protein